MLDLRTITLRMDPSSVCLLRSVLEAYDNLFLASTIEQHSGHVEVRLPPEATADLLLILESLADRLGLDRRWTAPFRIQ